MADRSTRFKIQEDGYKNGQWGTSTVITNGGLHYIDIPACVPDGQYLLRAEMIALHGAGSSGGAQLYVNNPLFLPHPFTFPHPPTPPTKPPN